MKKYFLITLLYVGFSQISANAQTRSDKLYTISGIGTSLPMGETQDYFGPKISTTLGLNYGVGNGGLFVYPKVSLHAFTYNGLQPGDGLQYTAQKARASTYLLNVALGYRKIVNKLAFYAFAGGGGGFILTPNLKVNPSSSTVDFSNETNKMLMLEGGAGVEYSLGGLSLFTEVSFMNGFNKIQNRNFTTLPVTIGLKPNLSKLFKQ